MSTQKQYDDEPWKMKIQFANSVFDEGKIVLSTQLYQAALGIAKQLFIDFKSTEPLPDALTPVLVTTYLNLADCWAAQNNKKEQILCLVEIYDFLKGTLSDRSISRPLSQQVYAGVSKIFLELCLYFKENDTQQILEKTEEDFSELSLRYQSQSSEIH